MKNKKDQVEFPYSVLCEDLWDSRFFDLNSRCINIPDLSDYLIQWASENIPDMKYKFITKKCRTHNGWGNRGGWGTRAQKCIFIFSDAKSEMLFRLKFNIFK